jgi:hypothetical protein
MSHYYGIIDGTGRSTRRGFRHQGLTTHAASWQGAVKVTLYSDKPMGSGEAIDMAKVELVPWHGAGTSKVLYDGPVGGSPVPVTSPEKPKRRGGVRPVTWRNG